MKSDLLAMFEVGQAERKSHPPVGTSEYRELRTRDAERRQRVAELMAAGEILRCAQDDKVGPLSSGKLVLWLRLEILRCAQDDNAGMTIRAARWLVGD